MTEIEDNEPVQSRDQILKKLQEIIEISHKKATKGRVKDKNVEKVRQAWSKVVSQAANVFLAGLKDKEIEELIKRIEELEKRQK